MSGATVVPRPGHALALDVGGSHVTAALVSLSGRRVLREARRTLAHDAPLEHIVGGWAEAALEAVGSSHVTLSHLGVAVPGPFDLPGGASQMTHKFAALLGVPLRPLLAEALSGSVLRGLTVRFGNDADLFALGEWWAGAGQGSRRMIGLTLGTGLGSGFVLDGQAVTEGKDVPADGELWNTPFRDGVAEHWACGAAVTRAWEAQSGGAAPLSAREVAALAEQGDTRATATFTAFGHDLAELLRPWAERFGAERVVLGGNVSRAFDLFAPAMQAGLPGCEVRRSEHFEQAGLLGAAALRGPGVPEATR